MIWTSIINAQTARVQVIHNSADLAASKVDIYLDDKILLDDFAFRTASPFRDAPAGVPLKIEVKPSTSTASTPALYTINPTLMANSKYILVADGIVSTMGYVAAPFGIEVYNMGRETATTSTNTDVLVHHGSTDAPTVDVNNVTTLPSTVLVNDASYKAFAGYLELPTADYKINVSTADGKTVVQNYSAPLQTLKLAGQAITVVASGFLDPKMNSNGPAFGLWVALAAGGPLVELPVIEARARVQVIHNCADLAAKKVDVYLNDQLLIDDFAFRTASPFIDAPAGVPIKIDIAASTSTSSANPLYTISPTLLKDRAYVLVADGIVSATGYSPAPSFGIEIYDMGREFAAVPVNTAVLIHHGATDAPAVDVNNVTTSTPSIVLNDAPYKAFSGYLPFPNANYKLNVTTADGNTVVGTYNAALQGLGLKGKSIVIVASGFLDPKKNSNGPGFGLWVAVPTGGRLIQLTPITTTRAQIIHNSADLTAKTVDVYLDGKKIIDDFNFRTSSPFIDVPAGFPVRIEIAPSNSTSSADAFFTTSTQLTDGVKYIIVVDGIKSSTGYSPTPSFGIQVYDMGRETAKVSTNTDVLVHHGSTDAPTVDINNVTTSTSSILVDNASYEDFAGYLELPTADYKINVSSADGLNVVQTYGAPLQTLKLGGQAITVVASGFLDPKNNSNGPAFGLWVSLAAGGPLVELPVATLSTNEFENKNIGVFPNPARDVINVDFEEFNNTTATIFDALGRNVIETKLTNSSTAINVSNLQKGMYVIRLSNSENTGGKTVKVVVE